MTSLTLGLAGVIFSVLGVDGLAYRSIFITFGFSSLGVFYLEFRKPRALIFLAIPFYVLALTFIMSLPFLLLFATFAFEVGILDAYQLSKLDGTNSSMSWVDGRGLRALLAPFSGLAILAKDVLGERPLKRHMFSTYSLLPVLLVATSLLIWLVAKSSDVAYFLTIATGVYFVIISSRIINRRNTG